MNVTRTCQNLRRYELARISSLLFRRTLRTDSGLSHLPGVAGVAEALSALSAASKEGAIHPAEAAGFLRKEKRLIAVESDP